VGDNELKKGSKMSSRAKGPVEGANTNQQIEKSHENVVAKKGLRRLNLPTAECGK
jgi:hypothetical protein